MEKIDSIGLNEIVVQASRNNSKLKTIPNSVSIISSKQIEALGINSLTDVTSTVANLFMPDYGSKLTSPIYIRGVGSRTNSPSVGLYVDHVPYFEKAAFNFDFFDINRIEVLRGPQGTQYGRNTMGGIVNILTKSPLNYQGTDLNIQAGTYGSYLLNVGHYAQPNDQFAWSLALNYRHNDGFFTNNFLNKQVDKLDSYGLRNRLIWNVTDRFSIENILSFEHSIQGGYPYALYYSAKDSVGKINYNQESGYDRNLLSDALLLKYRGKTFDITSTTSYQYLSDKQYIDQDFSKDSLYFATQKQKQHMLSEEFVIQSKNDKKYNWLFGAYGFIQQFNSEVGVSYYKRKYVSDKNYDHFIGGAAIFHQSTLKDFPVKNMNITAGIRMDGEIDKMDYSYDSIRTTATFHKVDTTYKTLNSMVLLPKLSVNYKIGNTNVYGLVAKGYKTGGFNNTFEKPEDINFDSEYSWNYEIGAKSDLFNGKLFVEASLFLIEWKNQQVTKQLVTGGNMIKNAGRSESKGLELSANTASFYGFELMSVYGFTEARYTEYFLNATTDYSGNFIPYVPRHTVSAQMRKTFNVIQPDLIDKLVFSVMYKGTGSIYWNDSNSAKQDYYNTFDARISFIKKNVQFDIWGTNLTSTKYHAYLISSSSVNQYVQTGKPMQIGVKLALKF
ncbi:MAG: TonB-dependent receptor plug domain-containing protein [Bacteroidales bacterium]|nr:TonB-dependent receptor plug domain-containing protein [Bacteroidales bacterium]